MTLSIELKEKMRQDLELTDDRSDYEQLKDRYNLAPIGESEDETPEIIEEETVSKNPLLDYIKNDDEDKYNQWKSKGAIPAYDYAKSIARYYYNGDYNNIDNNAIKERIKSGKATIFDRISDLMNFNKNDKPPEYIETEAKKPESVKTTYNPNDYTQTVSKNNEENLSAFSPEAAAKLTEKIGFFENLPRGFYQAITLGLEDKKFREIKEHIIKNEPITDDELRLFNERVNWEQEKLVRGVSFLGNVGYGAGYSLGLVPDFLIGSALGEVLGVGAVAGTVGTRTYLGLKEAGAGIKAASAIGHGAEKTVRALGTVGTTSAVNALPRGHQFYQERMIQNEIEPTDEGYIVFKESEEKPATAFMKSMHKVFIMNFAEIAGGEILSGVGAGIGAASKTVSQKTMKPVLDNLYKKYPKLEKFINDFGVNLSKKYEQMNGLPVVGKSTGWIKDKAHFDGFLEELGEESIEDALNVYFQTDNQERTAENYAKAIFKTPEEWAILSGVVLVQGGGLSVANAVIGESMARKGKTKDEIIEVMQDTTESQKTDIIDTQIKNGDIKLNIDTRTEDEKRAAEVRDNLYNKMTAAGQKKDVALSNSILAEKFFRNVISSDNEEAKERAQQLINNLEFRNDIPANEAILQQAAYHGTPHRFDNFSNEHIGKGEGAQVHGYGLYFAENRNVSEGYRKNLLGKIDYLKRYEYKLNGKPLDDNITMMITNELSSMDVSDVIEGKKKFQDVIDKHIEYINRDNDFTRKVQSDIQNVIDIIKNNPQISISDFMKEAEKVDKYRFRHLVDAAKSKAKSEGRKTNINDVLSEIENHKKIAFDERLNKDNKKIEQLKNIDWNSVEVKKNEGQVFEVDIPENDVLLDENKYFSEQPEKVQEAIKKLYDENWGKYAHNNSLVKLAEIIYTDNTRQKYTNNLSYKEGKSIYEYISDMVGSDKNASELLNQYGIKGITYNGLRDGRCYVIFDDKAINIMKTYYQAANNNSQNSKKSFNQLSDTEKEKVFEKEFINKQQIENDENVLDKYITQHINKTLKSGKKIKVGQAPTILQHFGVPDLPMFMPQNKYDCSTGRLEINGDIHNISDNVMKKLPSLLANPILIAEPTEDSKYKGNSRYVVTINELDNDKKPINVIIDYDWNGQRVNIIPTAYGRNQFNDYVKKVFNEAQKLNKTLYIDEKNLLSLCGRVQFPKRSTKGSNSNITYKDDIIKSVYDKNKTYFQSAETAGADGNNVEAAIKEYREKGTESKYFKKWFGDSKVVDENGKPIIVYHSTNNIFDTFDKKKAKKGLGFWFTDDLTYSKEHGTNTIAAYLKAEKIFDIEKSEDLISNYTDNIEDLINNPQIQNKLINDGYDSIKFNRNDGSTTYIVFNPEQIKSVDNRGTFDSNNPNIYFQRKKTIVSPNQLSLFDTLLTENQVKQEQLFQPQVEESKEVQSEIPEKIEKKDIPEKQDSSQKAQEIKDTGDSLLGNLKRDRKTYTWAELENMNDLLRKKYLSKSYVYQLDSIENYKKQGLSEKSIAFIHLIYSKINSRPSSYYEGEKDAQKIFFDSVHEIMNKTIKFAKENNDYLTNYSRNSQRNESLFNDIFPDSENKKPYNIFRAYPELNKKAIIVGGNKLIEFIHFGYSTAAELEKSLAKIKLFGTDTTKEKDKNTLTGWQTRFEVLETKYRGFALGDRKSHQIIKNDIPTKELAQQLAEQLYEYLQNAKSDVYTENYEQLRNHIPRRAENQNVNPEALIEVFGFRGINFGNWTKQKERQDFVNLAYDSFHDLAELLNLPPQAISLGGKLGLAFGAQGRSRAAGHFIPEFNEINLTRKSGAGALAHEWWHALDYYFGDQSKGKDFSGKAALSLEEQGELRPEIFEAMKQIKNAMKYSPLTETELKDRSSKIEENIHGAIEYYQNDIKNSFKKSKNAEEISKFIDDIVKNAATMDIKAETDNLNKKYMSLLDERRKTWENLGKLGSLLYHCQRLQQVNDLAKAATKYSKYFESASRLNTIEKGMGKGYWTSDTELGARAFASYILHKISQNNYTNYFLSEDESGLFSIDLEILFKQLNAKANGKEFKGDVNVKWFPADTEERSRIFSAFDNLFNQIKTREENGKAILYQEENEEEPEEKLIAGYTYVEIMDKMIQLNEELEQTQDKEEEEKLVSQINMMQNAFEYAENSDRYSPDVIAANALNVYYIMQGIEIPSATIEAELKSPQTYKDLLNRHKEKLDKQEYEYNGYYRRENDKSIITIMQGSNSSTVLHELAHFFLDSLNELAKIDNKAKEQLEVIDKWLGRNGEYTTAQHEKFARSFEAYLYKGKAPNNKLRQVFENFKEWLRSIYTHVSQLTEQGADISPEVEKLFDKIFSGDGYYEERKQANKLLKDVRKSSSREKIKNLTFVDDSQLDEVQKRHKDISYSILSKATGKSTKYLKSIFETRSNSPSIIKKREAIENLLDKTDDKIYVSGGMMQEWKEFYSDTGVSYENAESGADFDLAWQAYNTIVNRAYRNPEKMLSDELTQRGEYFEKEIENAQREYKLLLKEFKKGDRNVALAAVYDWLNSLNPEIKDDYENKFTYDAALIERNENFDKFDKAKQEIIKRALEVQNSSLLSSNEQFKEIVKSIMKNLDFLQPSDKAKMTVNILDTPDSSFLVSKIDSIMDIAKTMEDVRFRNNLAQDIHKELQTTKNIKKNGRTVGKYNYKTNKIFEHLRELDRLTPERANEIRLSESQLAQAEDSGLSPEQKLYNKFISYKANGRTFADTELMKDIYEEILKLKFIGKTAKSDLDLAEKFNEISDIDELIDIVNNKKEANLALKGYVNAFGNLESTINALFNKQIKEKYATEILYAETQSQAWQHEVKQKFEKETAKIYNLPDFMWDKKILDYLGEKHTYQEIRKKYDKEGNVLKERYIDRTLTKMDIIQAYIWQKNSVLEARLKNQFGEETLISMFDELSEADIKFANLLMKTAQSFYPLVNRVFIQKYGLDLPKVSCYFPSTPERGSEVDLYNEFSSKSLGNGFTKARSQSETQPMDFHNPVATLYSHIEGVGKFVFMSEALDRANIRFKDTDLKRVIINKYGEGAYRTLEQNLINITYKKEAQVFSGINKVLDNIIGNWIQANIAIKPIVGLKQLLSANNYAIDMPYMTWQLGFLKALATPKATIDYMMKIPYLKARFQGNFSNEFLKAQVENSAFAASKKLKDACTLFVKLGDIGAIIFGGKPYIDYLIHEKKMSEEDAIKQFIISTNRSQQSSAVSSLSNFQVNMTRNPVGKLMIAFKNAPQQYVRMCGDAIVSYKNGDITLQKCAQLLFQFGYLQPFLYAMMTSGSIFRFLFSGDDDDLLKDLKVSLFNFGSDALPLFGDVYKFALNKLAYKEKYMPMNMPLTGDIENEILKISKEDVSLADYLEAAGYLGLHIGLGYNYKAAVSMAEGVKDIAEGDVVEGSMKAIGYTDKRSKHIADND